MIGVLLCAAAAAANEDSIELAIDGYLAEEPAPMRHDGFVPGWVILA